MAIGIKGKIYQEVQECLVPFTFFILLLKMTQTMKLDNNTYKIHQS